MPPKNTDETEIKYKNFDGLEVKITESDDICNDSETFPNLRFTENSLSDSNIEISMIIPYEIFRAAIERLAAQAAEAVKHMTIAIKRISYSIAELSLKYQYHKIKNYPNKRIVHLALYAKKKRIRKKNLKRIFKTLD